MLRDGVELLRPAFLATLRDPEFLADAKKARPDVSSTPGEEVERLAADLFTRDPTTVARLRAILFAGRRGGARLGRGERLSGSGRADTGKAGPASHQEAPQAIIDRPPGG